MYARTKFYSFAICERGLPPGRVVHPPPLYGLSGRKFVYGEVLINIWDVSLLSDNVISKFDRLKKNACFTFLVYILLNIMKKIYI